MLEEYAAILVQKFLGNYVRGINKEKLKISAWQGDVELRNMQLRPEALNALKLPVKVKAGFLGSVRLKVPWTKLGQEPVLVYLDRIFILAEPALQVEGSSEEALQEAKRNRVKEMEIKLMEAKDELNPETNTSWLSSVINTIVGNLKLSISNIHIRYEDTESNPGHPFAAGLTLGKLLAVTIDDQGNETFATGVNLDRIQKSVVLESLAFYFDLDSNHWEVEKPWEDLRPPEWSQIFDFGDKDDSTGEKASFKHSYVLHPVTGTAKYTKLRLLEARRTNQALQKADVDLDDVTLSLSKNGYRDIILMADNFSAFNQRLKYVERCNPEVSISKHLIPKGKNSNGSSSEQKNPRHASNTISKGIVRGDEMKEKPKAEKPRGEKTRQKVSRRSNPKRSNPKGGYPSTKKSSREMKPKADSRLSKSMFEVGECSGTKDDQ